MLIIDRKEMVMPEKKAKDEFHALQLRVEMKLWNRFKMACIDNDAKPGEVLRDVMRAMVRENDLARQNNTYISFEEVARKKQIELRENALGDDAD
jgi:hypothetical protein